MPSVQNFVSRKLAKSRYAQIFGPNTNCIASIQRMKSIRIYHYIVTSSKFWTRSIFFFTTAYLCEQLTSTTCQTQTYIQLSKYVGHTLALYTTVWLGLYQGPITFNLLSMELLLSVAITMEYWYLFSWETMLPW